MYFTVATQRKFIEHCSIVGISWSHPHDEMLRLVGAPDYGHAAIMVLREGEAVLGKKITRDITDITCTVQTTKLTHVLGSLFDLTKSG